MLFCKVLNVQVIIRKCFTLSNKTHFKPWNQEKKNLHYQLFIFALKPKEIMNVERIHSYENLLTFAKVKPVTPK